MRLLCTPEDECKCFLLFPTRLLTSEDEYKWYWHQMIYFPETINTVSTLFTIGNTLSLVSSRLCTVLTLCMLASRSRGEVVFLSLLSSSHFVTSCHVFPLPLSGLNWCSLFPPWGSWPSFLKMAPPFTGSAHPPFPGSGTFTTTWFILLKQTIKVRHSHIFYYYRQQSNAHHSTILRTLCMMSSWCRIEPIWLSSRVPHGHLVSSAVADQLLILLPTGWARSPLCTPAHNDPNSLRVCALPHPPVRYNNISHSNNFLYLFPIG